jgi:hypothetical protein
MLRGLIAGSMVLFGAALLLDGAAVGGEKEITIKVVMQKAHKGGLLGKVLSGKASDEEKKQLVTYYEAMVKLKPPVGEEDAWKEKTKALLAAAKGEDVDVLKKASNCGACHSVFKKK